MTNIFVAGRDLVQWEVTAFTAKGPYKLTVRHPYGDIVEYFPTTTAALVREAEIEALLLEAHGPDERHPGTL